MHEISMPKLSDSMEGGRIIQWLVHEGEPVHEGDVLAEVESDKAVMQLECFQDGVLAKILHGNDSEVKVGDVIGMIADEGEAVEQAPKKAEKPKPAPKKPEPKPEPEPAPTPPAPKPKPTPAPAPSVITADVNISPYAKKIALEKGLDITQIKGTGPNGRITAHDVEQAARRPAPPKAEAPGKPSAPAAAPSPEPARPTPDEELPVLDVSEEEADVEDASFRQKTQAKRVTATKHVIPHFYLTRDADVTDLLAKKDQLKQEHGATVTHLVMLACIKALKKNPEVNRSYDRGRIIKWKHIRLGIAVQTDEGLNVAVLGEAEKLSLKEIVEQSRAVVEKARAGKLSGKERQHPTFTISNLGMHDIEHFEPIINWPSAITLGVASALPAAMVKDDTIYIGKRMGLTVSCDHRILDGVTAAIFLKDVKDLLENPDELLQDA